MVSLCEMSRSQRSRCKHLLACIYILYPHNVYSHTETFPPRIIPHHVYALDKHGYEQIRGSLEGPTPLFGENKNCGWIPPFCSSIPLKITCISVSSNHRCGDMGATPPPPPPPPPPMHDWGAWMRNMKLPLLSHFLPCAPVPPF